MMIENYQQLPEQTRTSSRFQILPVAHNFSMPGDMAPFPNSGLTGRVPEELEIVRFALEWFDYQLKGLPYNRAIGGLDAYAIGAGEWEQLEAWPPKTNAKRLYLAVETRERYQGGALSAQACEQAGTVSFTYDPDDPFPAKGADTVFAYLQPLYADYSPSAGPVRQDRAGSRADVLTFLSEPFPEETLIAGNIKVRFDVASDAEDTAFTAKIIVRSAWPCFRRIIRSTSTSRCSTSSNVTTKVSSISTDRTPSPSAISRPRWQRSAISASKQISSFSIPMTAGAIARCRRRRTIASSPISRPASRPSGTSGGRLPTSMISFSIPSRWPSGIAISRSSRKNDPYRHLKSIHNGDVKANYDHRKPWVSHVCIQNWDVKRTQEWRDAYGKPVVNDEPEYEGNILLSWGNISAEELVHRYWITLLRGGYAGHGETFMHPDDILWWAKGGVLHGEAWKRIGFLRDLLEQDVKRGLTPIAPTDNWPWSRVSGASDARRHLHLSRGTSTGDLGAGPANGTR